METRVEIPDTFTLKRGMRELFERCGPYNMHLMCFCVCACVCVLDSTIIYRVCVGLRGSLPYMSESERNERQRQWGRRENLGQIVEHADPLCRNTRICILSLAVDRTACVFIHTQDRGF